MLSLNFMTDKDKEEAAKLERRRIAEEERKKRIFDPRWRLFGIDSQYLEMQIAENKKRREEEKRIDEVFINQLKHADEIAVALAEKDRKERQQIDIEINKFRQSYQRPEHSREFDLNDPNRIKKQLPTRIDDNDPRLGPSSAQKFEGEDLANQERIKVQREQLKAWLDQQLSEKKQAKEDRKVALDHYRAAVISRDNKILELAEMERSCKRKLDYAIQKFNTALVEERKIRDKELDRQTKQDNLAEIYNVMTSDMLSENPGAADSNFGPGRKIASMFKGMTKEQKMKMRKEQMDQIYEKQKLKEMEKRFDKEYAEYFLETQKSVDILDKLNEKERMNIIYKMTEENKKLAEEQKNRKEYLYKIVYNNTPTEEFYKQFNTTTR
ncbi:RIB43A-like with coiled-coils protein 2 [Aethina tumida]|uniref:RIB43A-like with coiled-coils protein 2 n=1 Tax=Aethina tumida TaxID=116153 RepID=UPI00096B4848|nr:RIB43A-like with coiled-coils protein 2 [Aethina tumida]